MENLEMNEYVEIEEVDQDTMDMIDEMCDEFMEVHGE